MRTQPDKLKSILSVKLTLACLVSLFLFTFSAFAQTTDKDKPAATKKTPPKVHLTIELGGQIREVQGGHNAKFQELRDVVKGFTIPRLTLSLNSANSPYSLKFKGTEIRERDQRFTVDWEKIGKFRTQFMWDQIPHSF